MLILTKKGQSNQKLEEYVQLIKQLSVSVIDLLFSQKRESTIQ